MEGIDLLQAWDTDSHFREGLKVSLSRYYQYKADRRNIADFLEMQRMMIEKLETLSRAPPLLAHTREGRELRELKSAMAQKTAQLEAAFALTASKYESFKPYKSLIDEAISQTHRSIDYDRLRVALKYLDTFEIRYDTVNLIWKELIAQLPEIHRFANMDLTR
ncbi:hypothetical protein ACHAPU_007151 [Fusarium lateritium]